MQESAPSKTAEVVCLFRALERRRAQRIVDDPFAHHFLGRSFKATVAAAAAAGALSEIPARFLPGVATFVLARHRFIDDALAAALARGANLPEACDRANGSAAIVMKERAIPRRANHHG